MGAASDPASCLRGRNACECDLCWSALRVVASLLSPGAPCRCPGSCQMPGKAQERGKREGGDRKSEASSWFGRFAAGRVPPYLREAGEDSRRCGLLSRRVLASSGQGRKRWGGDCGSGPLKSACTEDALGCVASPENIWVCSCSDPRLEAQVCEQGKDGGWVSQRCERVKPQGVRDLPLHHPAQRGAAMSRGTTHHKCHSSFPGDLH